MKMGTASTNASAIFAKTQKGFEEMTRRTYRLPARMRALLIMIDGKTPTAELLARAASGDEANDFLTILLTDGFIEAVDGKSSVKNAANPSAETPEPLSGAKRFMVQALVDAFGPEAVRFTGKVEAATDMATLRELGLRYLEGVRAASGRQKAEALRAGLVQYGIIADTPGAPPAAAPASRPSAASSDPGALAAARQRVAHFLVAVMGPDADFFTGAVDKAASGEELRALIQKYGEAVRAAAGGRKAEEFRVIGDSLL